MTAQRAAFREAEAERWVKQEKSFPVPRDDLVTGNMCAEPIIVYVSR